MRASERERERDTTPNIQVAIWSRTIAQDSKWR